MILLLEHHLFRVLSRPEFQTLFHRLPVYYFCEGVGCCFLFIVSSPGKEKRPLEQGCVLQGEIMGHL